jgi:hypothetical protein
LKRLILTVRLTHLFPTDVTRYRIKESRTPQPVEIQKPKGQNRQGKNDASGKTEKFGNKGGFDKPKGGQSFDKPKGGQSFDKSKGGQSFDKSFDKGGKQEGKGNKEGKTFNKGQGHDNRPRGREFDKHSQGVVTRKYVPRPICTDVPQAWC